LRRQQILNINNQESFCNRMQNASS